MSAAPFQPGDVLGGYEIVDLLGRGGMGIVYRAHRPGLGEVALKTLVGGIDSEEGDRFRREVELLAALRHPAIVPVFGAGEDRGVLYYAMGIVEGESLEAKIRREGRLAPDEAARILVEVSRAVAFAHERKIIHRDLKPANVLLDVNGHAFVTDFGLGRQMGDERQRLTRTGEVLGTPFFMAPEQALGHSKSIDERADVYGLGAILYCALAGRPPFVGATAIETIRLVRERPPDPIEDVSPAWDELLRRVLAKNPDARPQTALDFVSELEDALVPRRALPRGLLGALLGLALVSVIVTGALVHLALERRRRSTTETAASPSPVTSAVAVVHTAPQLVSLLERIQQSSDRKVLPIDSLTQLKAMLDLPSTVEADRERSRPLVRRAYELAVEVDDVRFEQLANLGLPLPEEAEIRGRIARRWLVIAKARIPHDPVDLQAIAATSYSGAGRDPEKEALYTQRLTVFQGVLGPFARAYAVDPGLSYFPPELEAFFPRLLIAAGFTATPAYRETWRTLFAQLPDHPVHDFLEAKFEIFEIDRVFDDTVQQDRKIRAQALLALDHTKDELRAVENANELLELYRKEELAHPQLGAFKKANAEIAVLLKTQRDTIEGKLTDALTHLEHAVPGLQAARSPASGDVAEVILFDVLRRFLWYHERERTVHAFETYAGLVREECRGYSLRYSEAYMHVIRQDGTVAPSDLDTVVNQPSREHDAHMAQILQGLNPPRDH